MEVLAPEQFTAAALRRARQRAGLSARAASARAGLSQAAVCKAETGEHGLTLKTFGRLAHALSLTPAEVYLVVRNEARRG